jgi:guanylate kinase
MAKLFVISAPSGAGKNTLISHAQSRIKGLLYSISATTRKPRSDEKDGREYFFKTQEEFREMIAQNALAEYQEVYGGVYYGTPKRFIQDSLGAGKSVILDIDVYGRVKMEKVFPEAVTIFIDVPSLDVLRERLMERGSESPAQVEERLKKAGEEIAYSQDRYKYRIVNDDLEAACQELTAIIRNEISDAER